MWHVNVSELGNIVYILEVRRINEFIISAFDDYIECNTQVVICYKLTYYTIGQKSTVKLNV